jgi:hypothetical protein
LPVEHLLEEITHPPMIVGDQNADRMFFVLHCISHCCVFPFALPNGIDVQIMFLKTCMRNARLLLATGSSTISFDGAR